MNQRYLTISALDALPGIRHAFTTRHGGQGGRTAGFKSPDDWTGVADAFGIGADRLLTVTQVHGDAILSVDGNSMAREVMALQADGLITNTPGIAIGVETADCVPILLFEPRARAAGAVHAGWRSTVQQILRKTVERMANEFGADPGRMIAAIGPAIGPECYEVDEPVMGPVRAAFPFWREVVQERGPGRWGLDLVKLNALELEQAGVAPEAIHTVGLCTSCRRDLFYSFRAEGRTGRMLSVIMMQE